MLRVADYYSATDTGRQRHHNEDSLFARAPLFVVADGMGGAQAGEVASRTAVEVFGHGLDGDGDPQQRLVERVQEANAVIHELSQSNADQTGMGTTLTAVYVGPEEITVAHVGDSRAYCLRDGQLIRLTDDHSLVDELMRKGQLTPEEAETHPQRSIITRALGPEPVVEVDTRTHRARAGDLYLLCSDGLTSMVSEELVARILRRYPHLRDAGEALLGAANEAGGRDNITVVLFRVEEVGAVAGDQPTTIEPAPARVAPNQGPHTAAGAATGAAYATAAERATGAEHATGAESQLAAPAAAPTSTGAPVRRRTPRRPAAAPRRRRRWRRLVAPLVGLFVLALVAVGVWIATQSVYFLGTDARGFVTVYRGVPYDLPGSIHLYTPHFVSGVNAASLSPQRRRTLLDHSLRSRNDASDLVRRLELGQLSGA